MLLGQIKYSPLGDFVRDKDGVQLTTRLTGDNKNPSMGSRAGGGCVTAQSWEPVIPLPPLSPCCYSRGVEAAYQDEQGQGRAVPNNISELSLLIAHSPG